MFSLLFFLKKIGCVVQLDRISDFGSEGWGFESLRGHKKRQYSWRFLFFYNCFSRYLHK